jgi:RNA recognition motif-containing protein
MNPAFDNSGAPKTLYVGNLDHSVTEELVMVLFNQIGPVKVTENQHCGSGFIDRSGSNILSESGYGSWVLMTKNRKKQLNIEKKNFSSQI